MPRQKRIPYLLLLLTLAAWTLHCGGPVQSGTPELPDPADLDSVLARFLDGSARVDYAALAGDRSRLERYVVALARVSPDSHPELFPTEAARLAYWMNAYNALMLERVVRAWPIDSVKQIKPAFGVFWLEKHRLGGKKLSLRKLENAVIRKRFGDPRIHFAINCASVGCPPLPRRAWRATDLDEALDEATRAFVRDPAQVVIDPQSETIRLSSIFDWYADDFEEWLEQEELPRGRGVVDYVHHYLDEPRRSELGDGHYEIRFIDYDWSINAVPR